MIVPSKVLIKFNVFSLQKTSNILINHPILKTLFIGIPDKIDVWEGKKLRSKTNFYIEFFTQ